MVNSVLIPAQHQDKRCRALMVRIAFFGPDEEHVALLADAHAFSLLERWDNLLDEGVAAVFDLASGEAKLLALSFHPRKFTPPRAETWLAERSFRPMLFLSSSGRHPSADIDSPLAALIDSVAVSWEQMDSIVCCGVNDRSRSIIS